MQKKDKTWFRGKGFDTFAPVGPWIVSPEKVNLEDCELLLRVNNHERQKGNTNEMVFKISDLIHYISQIVTLYPGDIIFTGTCEGVGPIYSGDQIQAEIDGIGMLEVSVS